jgi:predicted lactoylglutathione lyase
MATKIFVNLPVKDLNKSKKFFTDIGFTINPQFTDEKAACVVISEDIYAMILREEFFKTFIPKKEITDATKTTEVLVALSAESKEAVNEMADKALTAGASKLREPEDHGFMYSRSFQDPDGHIWEVFWMDINAAPPTPQ